MKPLSKKKIKKFQKEGIDLDFISEIQPQGNVIFKDSHVESGDGYSTSLYIYQYPSKDLNLFWARKLVSFPNTVTTISVGTEDKEKVSKTLEKAIEEKQVNLLDPAKITTHVDIQNELNQLISQYNEISQTNSSTKRVYFRIFVSADSKEELTKRVKRIKNELSQFKITTLVGEESLEYQSTFLKTSQQETVLPSKRVGEKIPVRDLGGSYPFDHVSLSDPYGSLIGVSSTGGEVIFDQLHIDSRRKSPFGLISGSIGMGKSILAKKILTDIKDYGWKTRVWDVKGEYENLTKDRGGLVLDMSSSNNRINIMEIFPTQTKTIIKYDENGDSYQSNIVDKVGSFRNHSNLLLNIAKIQNKDFTGDDRNRLDKLITEFYIRRNIWLDNAQANEELIKATELSHEQYPTLSDFTTFLQGKADASTNPNENESYQRIATIFYNMLSNNTEMFNGVSRIPNLSDYDDISFDLRGLANGDDATFFTQTYLSMFLTMAETITNGSQQRELIHKGELEKEFVKGIFWNIDEAERFINPKFPFGVEMITTIMEQMRKDFAGLNIVTPTIKDLVIEAGESGSSDEAKLHRQNVSKMFGLFQYKQFFNLPPNDLDTLKNLLKDSVKSGELEVVANFEQGQALLLIQGFKNILFDVDVTQEEIDLFRGGL